jgi:hypothetical protein
MSNKLTRERYVQVGNATRLLHIFLLLLDALLQGTIDFVYPEIG